MGVAVIDGARDVIGAHASQIIGGHSDTQKHPIRNPMFTATHNSMTTVNMGTPWGPLGN